MPGEIWFRRAIAACPRSRSRATCTIRAPMAASFSAATCPMPDVAPVMTTTLPFIFSAIANPLACRKRGTAAGKLNIHAEQNGVPSMLHSVLGRFFLTLQHMRNEIDRRFGFAWLAFGVAIAIHVLDEAMHDFLSFYNPNAQAIRARFPFLPLPAFTFESWLTSLAIGIAIFFCLSPFAFWGMRWTRVAAVLISILVGVLNACGHIVISVYYHRWMPGVYSSPLLLLAAIFLMATARWHRALAADTAAGH